MARKGVIVQCSHVDQDGLRCVRWIVPGPRHTKEVWQGVAIWICQTCAEDKQRRMTRNAFRDTDEIQETIERSWWE